MGKSVLHLVRAENLECPIFEALHEGRRVTVGLSTQKRILHQSEKGAFFVKWGTAKNPKRKRYLSSGGVWVILNDVKENTKC